MPTYPDTLAPPTYPPRYAVARSQNGALRPASRKSSAVFAIRLNHIPAPIKAITSIINIMIEIITVVLIFSSFLVCVNIIITCIFPLHLHLDELEVSYLLAEATYKLCHSFFQPIRYELFA